AGQPAEDRIGPLEAPGGEADEPAAGPQDAAALAQTTGRDRDELERAHDHDEVEAVVPEGQVLTRGAKQMALDVVERESLADRRPRLVPGDPPGPPGVGLERVLEDATAVADLEHAIERAGWQHLLRPAQPLPQDGADARRVVPVDPVHGPGGGKMPAR